MDKTYIFQSWHTSPEPSLKGTSDSPDFSPEQSSLRQLEPYSEFHSDSEQYSPRHPGQFSPKRKISKKYSGSEIISEENISDSGLNHLLLIDSVKF